MHSASAADLEDGRTGMTSAYPLTVPWTILGVLLGILVGLLADEFLPGYVVFVLVAVIAMTWRRGDMPVLPFVLGYQWLSVTVGYWYQRWFEFFPSAYRMGDVDRTVLLACTGLLLLALGVRLASSLMDRFGGRRPAEAGAPELSRNLKGLFFVVMAAYAVDYVMVLNTRAFESFGVILEQVLALRQVLLLVLWLEVIRQRRGLPYLWISLAWVFLPRLGAYFSDFKSPLLLLAILIAGTWHPWNTQSWRRGAMTALKASPVILAGVFLALLWQAGVKRETRAAHDQQLVSNDPMERIGLFVQSSGDAWETLRAEPQMVVESLVERLSYITFFSRVLEHVPTRQPHADGELLAMAIWNSGIPRFLFPDKPVLPSDSYYTRRFTGIPVSDIDTSISIGYMAEFYADWGTRGMVLSTLAYGLWIGLVVGLARRLVRPWVVTQAAMIIITMRVLLFEHQFVKIFAALNVTAIVIIGALVLLRGPLARFLGLDSPTPETSDALARQARAPVN